ncbi:hypothetical protein LBMAG42_42620 [Deltaproteobacteria bacterium]|nr:hypothetical protein LBMAG42_42620 [Deltaproteobacteria bacterium]
MDEALPLENGGGAPNRRYFLSRIAIHKDGTPFRAPLEYFHPRAGVIYVETHLSHDAARNAGEHLVSRLGCTPTREMELGLA